MPRAPRAAQSTDGLQSDVFRALSRRLKSRSGPLFPLHVGDTWREPLAGARAEAQATKDHPGLHRYAPPQGEPALLDAIEEHLQRAGGHVERDRLQVVSGATVGLSLAAQTVLDPGDEVLLPSPFWPLIRGILVARGAVPVQLPVFTRLNDDGFDLEATLEAAVTNRTAALYLNTPHNPTGAVLSDDELSAVAAVARRHDLWVLADEVYEELWLERPAPTPAWRREDLRDRTVAVHSLSKSHGLAGARVGWAHGPAEVMRRLRRVQTHQVYCAARPMQLGAARALREGRDWVAETRGLYAEAARATAAALGLPVPPAGTFVFFDASPWLAGGTDCLPLLERCLDEGVLLTPGASCGADFAAWIRLCFTTVPPEQLAQALDRLRRVIG